MNYLRDKDLLKLKSCLRHFVLNGSRLLFKWLFFMVLQGYWSLHSCFVYIELVTLRLFTQFLRKPICDMCCKTCKDTLFTKSYQKFFYGGNCFIVFLNVTLQYFKRIGFRGVNCPGVEKTVLMICSLDLLQRSDIVEPITTSLVLEHSRTYYGVSLV